MKINQKNLIIVIILAILIGLVANFWSFNYVSKELPVVIKDQDLSVAGNVSSFKFISPSNQVTGIIAGFTKNFYIPDEQSSQFKFSIDYRSSNNESANYSKIYTISEIATGNREFLFLPIDNQSGSELIVSFTSLSNLPPKSLELVNQDYNPNKNLNTAPRIIYSTSIKELVLDAWSRLSQDRPFKIFYLAVSCLIIIMIMSLLIFRYTDQ